MKPVTLALANPWTVDQLSEFLVDYRTRNPLQTGCVILVCTRDWQQLLHHAMAQKPPEEPFWCLAFRGVPIKALTPWPFKDAGPRVYWPPVIEVTPTGVDERLDIPWHTFVSERGDLVP